MKNKLKQFISSGKKSIIALMLIVSIVFVPTQAQAGFPVVDLQAIGQRIQKDVQDAVKYTEDKARITLDKVIKQLGAVLFKNLLTIFFTELASQTAEWIASGGDGQAPLIFQDDWSDYLQGVGEAAVAKTVIQFSKEIGIGDICAGPDVAIDILLPEIQRQRSQRPRCSLRDLAETWDPTTPEFLERFTLSFETGQNDLGVAANFMLSVQNEKEKEEKAREKEREEGQGFKATKEKLTKVITAPGSLIRKKLEESQYKDSQFTVFTGEIAADTINAFTTTLFGELLSKYRSGFFSLADVFSVSEESDRLRRQALNSLTNPDAVGPSGGALAEAVYRDVFTPNVKTVSNFDILSEIGACPTEVQFASLYNCTADTDLIQALQGNQSEGGFYTIEQAADRGLLHYDWSFGYVDPTSGIEPSHENGYAYSNMKKLRRLRIIPVGWEMAALRAREIGQRVSLEDVMQAFDDEGSPFFKLVDPNWVLKTPNLRCTANGNSQLAIAGGGARYVECVDVQDCVSFGSNGQCLAYGYCTHDKRSWDFPGESCPEQFATCDQLVERGSSSRDNLWLTSTLEYEGCNATTAGCTWYSVAKNSAGEFLESEKIYLTDNVETCSATDAGCETFIRMGLGSNLLRNASFEDDGGNNYVLAAGDQVEGNDVPDGWQPSGVTATLVDEPVSGGVGVNLEPIGGAGCHSGLQYTAPIGSFEVGQNYTLSGYIQSDSLDPIDVLITFQGIPFTVEDVTAGYIPFAFQFTMPATNNTYELMLGANDGDCASASGGPQVIYDAVQLERGTQATEFATYGSRNVVYMNDAPSCTFEELGCKKYVPEDDNFGFEVTGIVTGQDLCPEECVGYQTYVQNEVDFEPQRLEDFIANTARQCSAEVVGCEQFTNLDEVALGGEGVEYYTEIRHCEKPIPSCGTFFTWEGSDVTGFQLSNFSLLTDSQTGIGTPVTTDGSDTCDPEDADCREFIAEDGTRYFRDVTKTVTCSEQCVPLRARAGLVNQQECEDRFGTYDTASERCVFQAIASESRSCQETQLGCREYVGNTGENVQVIYSDDFEEGFLLGWSEGEYSTESTTVGGHSIKLTGTEGSISQETSVAIPNVELGESYILDLTARSNVSDFIQVSAFLGQNPEDATRIGGFAVGVDSWNQYSLGPITIPNDAELALARLYLVVEGTSARDEILEMYFDNLVLRNLEDSLYAIKDSWDTPLTCDTNPPLNGGTATRSMVGCQAYTIEDDNSGDQIFAKSFTRLCSEEKIGCEAVIDTHESSAPYRQIFNEGDGAELVVPEDSVVYRVIREEFQCDQSNAGCIEVGKPIFDQELNITGYESSYVVNDPDIYGEILCQEGSFLCKEYTRSDGSVVFAKDPLQRQCEYRQVPNSFPPRYGWFKLGDDEENPEECLVPEENNYTLRCSDQHISCTQFVEPITNEAYYYKKNALLDRSETCNGVVDWRRGCVLFNDVSEQDLYFKSGDDIEFVGAPTGCQRGDEGCNANKLIKVNLNRVCSQWVTGLSQGRFWDKSLEQYRVSSYGLGRCLEADPVNPTICLDWDNTIEKEPLTLSNYQDRETSWGADEATGYSIPGQYPIETLRQRSVGINEDNEPDNFILTKLSTAGSECTRTTDCPVGQVCRVELDDDGGEFSGRCYVEQGIDGDGLVATQECRAYPEANSPFPSDLAIFEKEDDLENPGAIITVDQRFNNARIAQDGEVADCSYQKVQYEGEVQYYNLESVPPTTIKRNGVDAEYQKVDTFLGWQGYCLERDPSRVINGSDDEFACLSWYPVDQVQGTFDVNNSSLKAGYIVPTGAEYYCAEAILAEYRTTWFFCPSRNSGFDLDDLIDISPFTLFFDNDELFEFADDASLGLIDKFGLDESLRTLGGAPGTCGAGYETNRRGSCAGKRNKRECNPIGGEGWYPYDGTLVGAEGATGHLAVMCSKVAKISDAQGLAAAWTTRIQGADLPGSEEYFVSELGYGQNQSNPPYGSARPGVFSLEELSQPLMVLNPNEYVADCDDCKRQEYPQATSIVEKSFAPFGICQDEAPNKKDKPCPLYPNAGSPYALLAPDLSQFNDDVIRLRTDNKGADDGSHPFPGSESYQSGFTRLQELFAKSYGVWQWEARMSICVGTCEGGVFDGQSCASVNGCGIPEDGVTYECRPNVCSGGYKNGQACSVDTDCEYQSDENQIHQCVQVLVGDLNSSRVCETGPWAGVTCDSFEDCSEANANGVCSQGSACMGTNINTGEVVNGDNSGRACSSSSECNQAGTCVVDRCSSDLPGENSGVCSGKQAGDQCGDSGVTQQYNRIPAIHPASGWDLVQSNPSAPQAPIIRPVVPDPIRGIGFTEGFTTGITVNGVSNGDINAETGRAPINVSFYAYNENGEQMPLRLILIDWGDGSDPVEARGAFKNHKHNCRSFCSQESQQGRACEYDSECQDEDNPEAQCLPFNFGDDRDACVEDSPESNGFFSFTHTYTCESSSPCTYKPTVLVKDNWGASTTVTFSGDIIVQPVTETP